MDNRNIVRLFICLCLLASAPSKAQNTPFDPTDINDPANTSFIPDPKDLIAIDPVDPDFDPNDPRYRVLIPESIRPTRAPTEIARLPLGGALSGRKEQPSIEFTYGLLPAIGGALGTRIKRLEIQPAILRLNVGESFDMNQLIVRAYGTEGELIERAPLKIEIEGPEELIDFESFNQSNNSLITNQRGIGRLWIESILPSAQSRPFSLPVILIVLDPTRPQSKLSMKVYENSPPLPE